jgi:hypothetical protein
VLRLIGLWTEPDDIDAFELEYLGSVFSRLDELPHLRWSKTSRCIDGPYFRMTETGYHTLDDLNGDLGSPVGHDLTARSRALAEKYGVRLDVLVVADEG